jgi:hypothetical integral membrane protein (TIGR02206 family)
MGTGMGSLTWSWDFFLLPQNQPAPQGTGFGTFSLIHGCVLALLAAGVVALVLTYRRADTVRRTRIRLAVGWTVLMLEVLRQFAYIVTRTYTPDIVPLHLCAFATVAVFVDAVRPNRWTGDFLDAFGWWGALAADLFPDWANRPILNIFTWQSFSIHALIVGYVAMRLVARELVPDVRNLWRVAVVTAVGAIVAHIANSAWGTNFWFLNAGSAGSPLEPIQAATGAFYVPALVAAVAIVWTLLYLPWVLRSRRPTAASGALG